MAKPEPVHHKSPTGQRDISSLEQHQRQLLYGGGAFLSLIILLIMAASILLSINDYKSDQLDDFRKAKLALDSAFVQRDAGYIRTLNMIEYVWKNKSDKLIARGNESLADFASHNDEAIIQAGSQGLPWLVLGRNVGGWPKERLARYLGLMREMSVISGTSLTVRSGGPSAAVNFYDPSEALFAFGMDQKATGFDVISKDGNRADLFDKLAVPSVDFTNGAAARELRQGNQRLLFYGKDLPQVVTSVGKNPLTGEPSITGTLIAMDGNVAFGAFVAYEPIEPFVEQISRISPLDITVVTDDAKVVFGTGSNVRAETVASAIKPFLVLQPAAEGIARYHARGMFFVAERIAGTPWTMVRAYGWRDILHGEFLPIAVALTLAVLLIAVLWLLLIRQDRSVFAPVLARAKRVYQSEALNRAMIETSPVGLCVVAMNNAAPLLQNDLVRDYAKAFDDPVNTFYRQLLESFAEATDSPLGRPEAREFSTTLAGENVHHLLVAAIPIVYQDRNALFCVLRDVTARIELEKNLKRARSDSERAMLAAESASRAKTSFVATMSHEIRTPLNGILGHLELLGHSHLEPAQRERLGRIRLSADALLAIISDVLDFSRIEAGQLDIDPLPFELRPLIEQAALLYAPAAQRKGLKLYYAVESGMTMQYVADVHRIRQVLNNLISNAVKFTESGRIILRVRQTQPQAGEPAKLRFEVTDSGIGMTEHQREQVFQPFSQADASISRRFGGSGLGLTLCRQLSELMHGHIGVQSTPGVGSVFSFELPAVPGQREPVPFSAPLANHRIALLSLAAEWRTEIAALLGNWGADVMVAALPSELDMDWLGQADALVIFDDCQSWHEEEEYSWRGVAGRVVKATVDGPLLPELRDGAHFISCYSSAALLEAILGTGPGVGLRDVGAMQVHPGENTAKRRQSVLLVDDNPVNRELIQQQLETLGYVVDAAEDGLVALRLWHEDRYDAVLTDINMPHMDGYGLTEQLRARGATIPILAITATALTSEKMHCQRAGINDLLLKPLSLERLGEAMSRHLAQASSTPASLVKVAWAAKYPEKICRVFVESGTRDLDAIVAASHSRDQDTLLSRIHSVKGALLMLGEQEMASQCATLEKWIGADGMDAACSGIERLESAMRELLQRYAEFI